MAKKSFVKKDVYQEVTNKIIAKLEAGTVPWVKEWDNQGNNLSKPLPYNFDSGNMYSGMNILSLWMSEEENQFTSNAWMTFAQAKKKGGNIIKGQKGTSLFFFKFVEKVCADTGTDKSYAMPKPFTVFNLDQIEGIELPTCEEQPQPHNGPINTGVLLSYMIDQGIKLTDGKNTAYYSPTVDRIGMPPREQFHSESAYFGTLAHECIHSTGHKKRLDRFSNITDILDTVPSPKKEYAFEELIAELGAAFLCAETGIQKDNEQTAAYIGHWLKCLKSDKKFIAQAASRASKATKYINEAAEIKLEKAA
ncbi:MAG: DNA primase [Thalassobium sp.]|nr:MAG: DNA primase [Thalassobium sp.]